jgi:hypothetical protein
MAKHAWNLTLHLKLLSGTDVSSQEGGNADLQVRVEGRNSGIRDDLGVNQPDREHALAYARAVARELMRGHELQTRWWLLNVYDEAWQKTLDVPFASLDPALDLLKPELRAQVIEFCERVRTLRETVASAKITMRESQALVARSRGRPYLATDRGERTIRPL